MTSVLQDWVMELPLREQGVLMTAIRGCDTEGKFGPTKALTQYLRYSILNPADPREIGVKGAFFSAEKPEVMKTSAFDQYPFHYVMHLLHAAQIIGVRCPIAGIADYWLKFYVKLVYGMHLRPELPDDMIARLSEDRIAKGNVVS